MEEASQMSAMVSQTPRRRKVSLKRANQRTSWIVGLVLSLGPPILCLMGKWLKQSDVNMVVRYDSYLKSFFSEGEFLWLSITLLGMALSSVILYGVNTKGVSRKKILLHRGLILFLALVIMGTVIMFYDSIATPNQQMFAVSIIIFALFGIASYFVTFVISKEGE